MWVRDVPSTVMATRHHPTTESDDDAVIDDGRDTERPERPGVGIAHRTVVPTNFERDD
jgi:hypothetical protein